MTRTKKPGLCGRLIAPLVMLSGALSGIGVAAAQDISTYYTVMHPDKFTIDWKAVYTKAEAMTAQTREELPHELNVSYGADPKQSLDVYLPRQRPSGAPVLIFLHGGGNREGDKAQYGYVAAPFAKHGIVTVVASYRLQPAFPWPAQRDDAQAVVAWVYHNIKSRGGDPNRIYLAGHSAGSQLTAVLSYRDGWRRALSLPNDVLKGGVLISSLAMGPREGVTDPALLAELDVLHDIAGAPPRNVLAIGGAELEGDVGVERRAKAQQLAANVRATGNAVDLIVPEGLDHATVVLSLGDERSELFRSVLSMIEGRNAKR